MSRRRAFWIVTMAAAATVLSTNLPAVAQDGPTAKLETPQAGETQTPAKKTRTFRGRLPAYFAKVVDDKQRKAIYAIQKEYKPKIDELKAQLAALTKERDEKIIAELTTEQRDQIEAARKAAQDKRKSKANAKKAANTAGE